MQQSGGPVVARFDDTSRLAAGALAEERDAVADARRRLRVAVVPATIVPRRLGLPINRSWVVDAKVTKPVPPPGRRRDGWAGRRRNRVHGRRWPSRCREPCQAGAAGTGKRGRIIPASRARAGQSRVRRRGSPRQLGRGGFRPGSSRPVRPARVLDEELDDREHEDQANRHDQDVQTRGLPDSPPGPHFAGGPLVVIVVAGPTGGCAGRASPVGFLTSDNHQIRPRWVRTAAGCVQPAYAGGGAVWCLLRPRARRAGGGGCTSRCTRRWRSPGRRCPARGLCCGRVRL